MIDWLTRIVRKGHGHQGVVEVIEAIEAIEACDSCCSITLWLAIFNREGSKHLRSGLRVFGSPNRAKGFECTKLDCYCFLHLVSFVFGS